MSNRKYSTLLIAILFLSQSCQSQSIQGSASSDSSVKIGSDSSGKSGLAIFDAGTSLIGMSCEKLIEKAGDEKFALNGLAGIRAHKNCKNYKFDFKELSDIERRIYAEEIEESDPTKPVSNYRMTIADFKKNLKVARQPADKMKAFKQLRAKQKSAGLRTEFLKTTAEMFNWTKNEFKKSKKDTDAANRFYEATQLFARTYWTEDRHVQADQILTDTLRLLKGVISVAEIYFIQGRMAEEDNDHELAVSNYDLVIEDIKKYSPKTISFTPDRIQWLKSWILYKNKKWAEAEKSFEALYNSTTDNSEKSRALFYQSRCFKELDRKDDAKKNLEKIIQDDFFGYYGLVSYHELGRKMPALSKIKVEKKFAFDLELAFLSTHEKEIFQELIKYQEVDLAERAVPILAKGLERHVNLGLYLAENGKRYLPLFAAFAKLTNEGKIEVLLKYPELVFPQPYPDQVKAMAEKTQLPSSLIYSIMKQESAFNARTRSHADAMGLMQMIPRLAKQLSKKFEIPYAKPEDLYNPHVNIQLGSYELMEQVRKQDGQLTYVAAAYNAGPNALRGWLKTRNASDTLEFIEEIPYEETRTYVKLIARNKLFYERISKRDEEHPFPIEFLNLSVAKQNTSSLLRTAN